MNERLNHNEDSLARAQRIAHVGDWEWDVATDAVHWSEELFRIYGFTPYEVSPDYALILERMHPDSKDEFLKAIEAALKEDRHFEMDYRFYRQDGSEAMLHTIGEVYRDPDGNPVRMAGIVQDITERKRAEADLRESELKFRTIFDKANDGIIIVDPRTRKFVEANARICSVLGYTREEMMSLGVDDIHPPEALPRVLKEFERQMRGEKVIAHDLPVLRKDGTVFYVDVSATYLNFGGQPHAVGIFRDITERKEVDQALRESEEKFRTLVESMSEGLGIQDRNGVITYMNRRACEMFGYEADEIIGRPMSALFDEVNFKAFQEQMSQRKKGRAGGYEITWKRKDGKKVHTIVSPRVIVDDEGNFDGSFGVFTDITEHKLAEDKLRKSEIQLQESQRVAKIGSWSWNLLDNTLEWSDETYRRFDKDPATFDTSVEYFVSRIHPDDSKKVQEAIQQAIENNMPYHIEPRIVNETGREWVMEAYGVLEKDEKGKPVRFTGTAQDVTDRKQAEEGQEKLREQLAQAQKLESIGRLAGGIAHDFNNALQTIMGHTELALREAPEGSNVHESLEAVQRAAEHSTDLTRQLLAFARRQTVEPKVLDLNEAVSGILKMLKRLMGEEITVSWMPQAEMSFVSMDPAQVYQLLANLCGNAREAIEGVGSVTIKTGNFTMDDTYCDAHNGFSPGDYVMLEVCDDGTGMEKEVLDHIFEPFFTTRDIGKGTGLGLATVYGIVKQNDGFINAYSELGQGTCFKIYLPAVGERQAEPEQRRVEPSRGRGEKLLLVEDENAILELGAKILNRLGYDVIAAATPEEAIRLAQEHGDGIQLLITDVVMPEMNGQELATRLKEIKPGLKCLFMSGYSSEVITHHGVLDEGLHFIHKPFSIEGMGTKVRQVLDAN